jgi:hypothetical protein
MYPVDYTKDEKASITDMYKKLDTPVDTSKATNIHEYNTILNKDIRERVGMTSYIMERQLVGVCFTWNEALRLKESYDASLRPHIEILSRYDIKGYHELAEIAEYFKNKAKEIF